MPLKLLSPGGGSVLLQANTTSLDYTLTVPAETANLITTATSSGINASALTIGTVPTGNLPTIPVAKLPTGSILQVVNYEFNSTASYGSMSNASYNTLVTGSITPTSSSSKILITGVMALSAGDGAGGYFYGLKRGSTVLGSASGGGSFNIQYGMINASALSNGGYNVASQPIFYVDSPATTSSTTYTVYVQGVGGTGTLYINRNSGDYVHVCSYLTLMEIAG